MKTKEVTLYVSRRFSAAHHLPYYDGPCNNLHGHTWHVEVWLTGTVDPDTGMVVDFKDIKNIIDHYDHRNLNVFFDNPTAEHIVSWIHKRILSLDEVDSVRVRLWESENSYAEVSS